MTNKKEFPKLWKLFIYNSWGEIRTLEPFGYEPNALTN